MKIGDCTKCYKPILKGEEVERFGCLYHKKPCRSLDASLPKMPRRPRAKKVA